MSGTSSTTHNPLPWNAPERFRHPAWNYFNNILYSIDSIGFPTTNKLQNVLPRKLINAAGFPIRLVSSELLPPGDYEDRIRDTGEVSTRPGSWHDLCNALCWAQWPATKLAMNQLHHEHRSESMPGRRGALRDRLAHFDECGAVVVSTRRAHLDALAHGQWKAAFVDAAASWDRHTRLYVIGHGTLEKCLSPYKALTVNALLLLVDGAQVGWIDNPGRELDNHLAAGLRKGALLGQRSDLAPIPLAGLPGWWHAGPQDAGFYADERVFRMPPPGRPAASIFSGRSIHRS